MAAVDTIPKTLIDQKEYLKRYLTGKNSKKERISKKKIYKSTKFLKSKIIDDDVDVKNLKSEPADDHHSEEETPVVAAVVDERPEHIKQKEIYVSTRWKTLGQNEENESLNDKITPGNSPLRKRHDSGSDYSLPRVNKRHDSGSDSPSNQSIKSNLKKHGAKNDSEGDLSPLRPNRSRKDSGSDLSPPRTAKNRDSDSDLSPPRGRNSHQKHTSSSKTSRRPRSGSDSDLSPPRTIHKCGNRHSRSPKRRKNDSGSDLSPVRKSSNYTDRNQSRYERSSTSRNHNFATKRSKKSESPPPTHGKNADNKRNRGENSTRKESDKHHRAQNKVGDGDDRLTHTLSGLKAGLQNASSLRNENQHAKAKEKELMKKLSADVSGKGAQTVFRDRQTGERRNFKEERRLERLEKQKKEEQDEKYMQWGTGIKQKEDQKNKLEEDLYEMSKPLARYSDDIDLDKHLREQERDGDPMLQYLKKKKQAQVDPNTVRPTYKGPIPPPNRFGIPPGYRWDGVDRSNGFEKKLVERKSNKIAHDEQAYKWSVENM